MWRPSLWGFFMVVYSFAGKPFCGKGTLIKLLPRIGIDARVFPMSGILMKLRDSPICGVAVREAMDSGNLVSDDVTLPEFMAAFDAFEHGKTDVVLDGCIRTSNQARQIADKIRQIGIYEVVQIVVDVPTEACWRRLGKNPADRGVRTDDKEVALKNRFGVYEQLTVPAIERFSAEFPGRTVHINNDRDPEISIMELKQKLDELNRPISEEAKKYSEKAAAMGFTSRV